MKVDTKALFVVQQPTPYKDKGYYWETTLETNLGNTLLGLMDGPRMGTWEEYSSNVGILDKIDDFPWTYCGYKDETCYRGVLVSNRHPSVTYQPSSIFTYRTVVRFLNGQPYYSRLDYKADYSNSGHYYKEPNLPVINIQNDKVLLAKQM